MERRLDEVVDVMRVPASGDANVAVLKVGDTSCCRRHRMRRAGRRRRHGRRRRGTGGGAPRLPHLPDRGDRLARRPAERTRRLGARRARAHRGLRRHREATTRCAMRLRDRYRDAAGAAGREPAFNPGDCWVSRLAFEPAAGAQPDASSFWRRIVASGRLSVFLRCKTIAIDEEHDRIRSVTALQRLDRAGRVRFHPTLVIDATELGDLLPLSGAEYRVGAEAAATTGEAHAQPHEARPTLRAELHLHLRRRAPARRRAPRHRRAREVPRTTAPRSPTR